MRASWRSFSCPTSGASFQLSTRLWHLARLEHSKETPRHLHLVGNYNHANKSLRSVQKSVQSRVTLLIEARALQQVREARRRMLLDGRHHPCVGTAALTTHFTAFRFAKCHLAKVSATKSGKTSVASAQTLTGRASLRIFPQETASSGEAPESLPSNSEPVLR